MVLVFILGIILTLTIVFKIIFDFSEVIINY